MEYSYWSTDKQIRMSRVVSTELREFFPGFSSSVVRGLEILDVIYTKLRCNS